MEGLAVPGPKATARHTAALSEAAAAEASAAGLSGGSARPSLVQGPNSSRALYRILTRAGLLWKVPITELQMPGRNRGELMHVPALMPRDFMLHLLQNAPDLLWGGDPDPVTASRTLASFWRHYKSYHPEHLVYKELEGNLNQVIPLVLHGDEGRGLRKGQCAVMMLESPLGLGTSLARTSGCVGCCCSNEIDLDHAARLVPDMDFETFPDDAGCHQTNMTYPSFLSRFPLWVLHSRDFKEVNGLMERVVRETVRSLHSLFYEGLTINQRHYFFAVLGLKGDLKWVVRQVCHLQRSYMNLGLSGQLMCHECQAGDSTHAFEHVGFAPPWEHTVYTVRPWNTDDYDSPFSALPFEGPSGAPERLFRRDLFHILKLGVYRDWTASIILLLIEWRYFNEASENSLEVRLARAFGGQIARPTFFHEVPAQSQGCSILPMVQCESIGCDAHAEVVEGADPWLFSCSTRPFPP